MRPRPCTTCGALIVFVEMAEGRRMSVDAATVRPGQDRYDAGLGQVPHWATCNAPARHRRGNGRRSDGRGRGEGWLISRRA
jgi:hypothetical protein